MEEKTDLTNLSRLRVIKNDPDSCIHLAYTVAGFNRKGECIMKDFDSKSAATKYKNRLNGNGGNE
jgi:hypothetical protein